LSCDKELAKKGRKPPVTPIRGLSLKRKVGIFKEFASKGASSR